MDIPGEMKKVLVFRDHLGLEPTLEEGTDAPVPLVDRVGIGHPEALHKGRESVCANVNQHVVVVGHQAVRDDLRRPVCDELAEPP